MCYISWIVLLQYNQCFATLCSLICCHVIHHVVELEHGFRTKSASLLLFFCYIRNIISLHYLHIPATMYTTPFCVFTFQLVFGSISAALFLLLCYISFHIVLPQQFIFERQHLSHFSLFVLTRQPRCQGTGAEAPSTRQRRQAAQPRYPNTLRGFVARTTRQRRRATKPSRQKSGFALCFKTTTEGWGWGVVNYPNLYLVCKRNLIQFH